MKSRARSILPGLALGVLLAGSLTGCAGTVTYSARAQVAPSQLVSVGPGVWAVYDYHEPVFYSDGAYWWWNGGVWYRSSYIDYGFQRASYVSPSIVRIQRPTAYVHYRSSGNVRSVPRGHVRGRYAAPAPRPTTVRRQAPPPQRVERRGAPPGRGYQTAPGRGPGRGEPAPARGRGYDDRGRGSGGRGRGR